MAAQHPFAPYVAAVGRGPGRSRDLSEAEAAEAMGMILRGEVEPLQLGGFLIALRYKKETPEELAGFVRAGRAGLDAAWRELDADLDWPSYADRHRQLPWFVLSALLLSRNGVRVAMHGIAGEAEGYAPTRPALAMLGIAPSRTPAEAAAALDETGLAYIGLEDCAPGLEWLFSLRPLLGLRSPVNSAARELNPAGAPAQIQGVFHPTYREPHGVAAKLLGQPRAAVFKGVGGEAQRNPFKPCAVETVNEGARTTEDWPALIGDPAERWRDEDLDPARIPALWRGETDDPAPTAAVTGTAAIALKTLGRAGTMEEAQALADEMWAGRIG